MTAPTGIRLALPCGAAYCLVMQPMFGRILHPVTAANFKKCPAVVAATVFFVEHLGSLSRNTVSYSGCSLAAI